MAGARESTVDVEDYDLLLELFEADILNEDEEFIAELEGVVAKAESVVITFKCDFCELICKSKQGLSRHVNCKHPEHSTTKKQAPKVKREPQSRLHPATFKNFVNQCSLTLSKDECYSEKTRSGFTDYTINQEEAILAYENIKELIGNFNGNGEVFYPCFYNIVCEKNMFPRLSKKCSRLLGFEVANHVVSHLNTSDLQSVSSTPNSDNSTSTSTTVVKFDEKEMNIITYLSGYVFSTLYKRLRRSAQQTEVTKKYLSLLLAGKSSSTAEPTKNEKLIEARDRGGLWKVNQQAIYIFEEAEKYFKAKCCQ